MIPLLITLAAAGFGFWQARRFVTSRLRFVDAVHSPWAAILAGLAAAVVFSPVALLLPWVTTTTALAFGGSVAGGVLSGARDIRKRLGA